MSIVLERNNSGGDNRIQPPGLAHRSLAGVSSIYNSPDFFGSDWKEMKEEHRSDSLSSSSSSSIGKNSDECSGGDYEEEVQSEYIGGPLDSLDALEEVLPIKKSISNFYCGKSKSYTSLSDAACSSIQEITKPENAYTRKRKNLLAFNNFWDKNNHNSILKGRFGSLSKRSSNSRSMFSLVATMNCSESNSSETETSNSNSSSPGCSLPPLPPHARKIEVSSSPHVDKFSSCRTFSLSDLQCAATAEAITPNTTGLWINKSDK